MENSIQNTPIIGRIYHVVDKTTGEVVKVGSTIRSLEQRFSQYDYKRKYKNHFLREVKNIQSSDNDRYEKGNALCPFLWHLVASEHLEMLKVDTFRKDILSNKVSPLDQKFFGLDGSEFGRQGGLVRSKKKLLSISAQGRKNVMNGHLLSICVEGGRIQGNRAALNGQIANVGRIQGRKNANELGRMQYLGVISSHNRWHVRRGIVSATCKICTEAEKCIL